MSARGRRLAAGLTGCLLAGAAAVVMDGAVPGGGGRSALFDAFRSTLSGAARAEASEAPPRIDESLVEAVEAGHREAALALIARGADVNAGGADHTTPLHWAVHRDDAALTKKLLAAGARVDAANDYGATPMSVAAAEGNADVIGLLLDAGANVDSPTPEGQTALMAVARTGRLDAARLLLEHGANVNAKEQWGGQTALMWAAAQKQPAMVQLLVQHGADVNARATVRDWQRRVTAEPRIKEMLHGGLTALLYAAREDCAECARHLVEGGADIDLTDPDGVTPLVLALINMSFDTARYLVSAGANVNLWDWWGRSPLYAAIDLDEVPKGGRQDLPPTDKTTGLEVAKMLLDRGANPNFQLKLVPPLRSIVFDRGGDSAVLNTGATPLLRAAYGGNVEAVRLLLAYHPLVNLPNLHGITPTMAAAGLGHGANPTRGRYRTEEGAIAELGLLLAAGGDVNARDADGETALHGAARKGWTQVVQYLADHGAKLNVKDASGRTALDYAAGRSATVTLTVGQFDTPKPHPETQALLEKLEKAAVHAE